MEKPCMHFKTLCTKINLPYKSVFHGLIKVTYVSKANPEPWRQDHWFWRQWPCEDQAQDEPSGPWGLGNTAQPWAGTQQPHPQSKDMALAVILQVVSMVPMQCVFLLKYTQVYLLLVSLWPPFLSPLFFSVIVHLSHLTFGMVPVMGMGKWSPVQIKPVKVEY